MGLPWDQEKCPLYGDVPKDQRYKGCSEECYLGASLEPLWIDVPFQ